MLTEREWGYPFAPPSGENKWKVRERSMTGRRVKREKPQNGRGEKQQIDVNKKMRRAEKIKNMWNDEKKRREKRR